MNNRTQFREKREFIKEISSSREANEKKGIKKYEI